MARVVSTPLPPARQCNDTALMSASSSAAAVTVHLSADALTSGGRSTSPAISAAAVEPSLADTRISARTLPSGALRNSVTVTIVVALGSRWPDDGVNASHGMSLCIVQSSCFDERLATASLPAPGATVPGERINELPAGGIFVRAWIRFSRGLDPRREKVTAPAVAPPTATLITTAATAHRSHRRGPGSTDGGGG